MAYIVMAVDGSEPVPVGGARAVEHGVIYTRAAERCVVGRQTSHIVMAYIVMA